MVSCSAVINYIDYLSNVCLSLKGHPENLAETATGAGGIHIPHNTQGAIALYCEH